MIKIIFFSAALVLMVLAIDRFWSLGQINIGPQDGQKLIHDFQDLQESLPQKAVEGVGGAVKGVQTGIAEYFVEKTGKEIAGILKDLPPEQQETIKKEYCGK